MADTFVALTAAGIVYDKNDFADPHLDGPTALTVTADGRVFGHLASHGTCHIGYGDRCVTPPTSASGYKYFHQGVVKTTDGDLPVGKLTIGTGHATLGQDAVAAAAHYDNTGAVVAAVRAGEDEHGIWLAGRLVPGTSPERVDELRRSGVSGDWRGVNGHMELVAALAVNVPGFPVPRTEQLVAAGGVESLVAAGVVAPASPPTTEEIEALVAAAVGERFAMQRRREAVAAQVEAIVASAGVDRRARAVAEVERVQAARAADDVEALTAAVDSGIPGHLPAALKRYWTKGAGLARWSTSPHPYTALTRALRSELPPKAQHMVNGLAANLFKAVFGIYPGQRKELTAAGAKRRVRTQEGATRFGVPVGDLIPDAIEDVQNTAGNLVDAAGKGLAKLVDPDRDDEKPPKAPDGPDAPDETPADDAPAEEASAPDPEFDNIGDTPQSVERSADGELLPDSAAPEVDETPAAPEPTTDDTFQAVDGLDPDVDDFGETPAPEPGTPITDTDIPPRLDGTGRLEEDQAPATGAYGGALVDFAGGIAYYDDGSDTDGQTWRHSEPYEDPESLAASAAAHARAMRALGYTIPNRRTAGGAYPKG